MARDDSPRLAHWVHWTLLSGVGISALLLGVGLILFLVQGPVGQPFQADSQARKSDLPATSVGATLRLAVAGDSMALMQVGLLILIATPMVRVLVLALGWSLARERRFAIVAWGVLVLLGVSLLLGFG